jgi:hypothetical protein
LVKSLMRFLNIQINGLILLQIKTVKDAACDDVRYLEETTFRFLRDVRLS